MSTPPRRAIEKLAIHLGYDSRAVLSRSRSTDAVLHRHMLMFIVRRVSGASLYDMGRAFGVHHSSVVHGVQRIALRYRSEPAIASIIDGAITWYGQQEEHAEVAS